MKHLIDKLQIAQGNNNVEELIPEVIEMLRQQQAEIEQWGVDFDKLTDDFIKQQAEIKTLKKELYFKDYYEELPDTPVDLLRKAQEQ